MDGPTAATPTPITILTGFLGAGKTTLLISLLPQLPKDYTVALLKNEFGDVAIDSKLAGADAVSGVREMLNGCICCNLVGQLGDALVALREGQVEVNGDSETTNGEDGSGTTGTGGKRPDRIIIETSGSAFPATLAMEVNRLAAQTTPPRFTLDGVISVIDVENWEGYDDTSVTAKMQAQYTDLIILNKWEDVTEHRIEEVRDRLGDLELETPIPVVRSDRGRIPWDVLLGIDGALAQNLGHGEPTHQHEHKKNEKSNGDHNNEVDVLSALIPSSTAAQAIDLDALTRLLQTAAKDEVYRIKGFVRCSEGPKCSSGEAAIGQPSAARPTKSGLHRYILNWAFGRWTYTFAGESADGEQAAGKDPVQQHAVLQLTIITSSGEGNRWKYKIEKERLLRAERSTETAGEVDNLLQIRKLS